MRLFADLFEFYVAKIISKTKLSFLLGGIAGVLGIVAGRSNFVEVNSWFWFWVVICAALIIWGIIDDVYGKW